MRAKLVCTAATFLFLAAGLHGSGQEIIPTPAPSDANAAAANTFVAPAAEDWRYRWYDGRWWYWTPQDCWMWYGDDGRWVEYQPGAPAGVWARENVNVSVGRWIGVDVWGPHGDVRVGRIHVGW